MGNLSENPNFSRTIMSESAHNDPAAPVTPDAAQTSFSPNLPDATSFSTAARVGSAVGAAAIGGVGALGALPKDVQAHNPSVAEAAAQAFANRIGIVEEHTGEFGTRPSSAEINGVRLELAHFPGVTESSRIAPSTTTAETLPGPDIVQKATDALPDKSAEQVEANAIPTIVSEIAKSWEVLKETPQRIFAIDYDPDGTLRMAINKGQIQKSTWSSQKTKMEPFVIDRPLGTSGSPDGVASMGDFTKIYSRHRAGDYEKVGDTEILVGEIDDMSQPGEWGAGMTKIAVKLPGSQAFEGGFPSQEGVFTHVEHAGGTKFFAHLYTTNGSTNGRILSIDAATKQVASLTRISQIYGNAVMKLRADGTVHVAGVGWAERGIVNARVNPVTNEVLSSEMIYTDWRGELGDGFTQEFDADGNVTATIAADNQFNNPGIFIAENGTVRKIPYTELPLDPNEAGDRGGPLFVTSVLRDSQKRLVIAGVYGAAGEQITSVSFIRFGNGDTVTFRVPDREFMFDQKDTQFLTLPDGTRFFVSSLVATDGGDNLGTIAVQVDAEGNKIGEPLTFMKNPDQATVTPTPTHTATPSPTKEPVTPTVTPTPTESPAPTHTATPPKYSVFLPRIVRNLINGW